MNTETTQHLETSGLNGPPVLVHKEGCEGALSIGSLSGSILTPVSERPDWSEGLAVAKLAERNEFYTTRLGPEFADKVRGYDIIDFRDLGWVGVDAEGAVLELDADHEFRMDVIAEVTGVTRTDDISAEANFEDIPGQSAYVVTDESHEYANAKQESGIVSKTFAEKLADAAKASERALNTGT